ncbi:hypothetical protein BKE38_18660 [Pseudoroseomonas deserti]|uniref:Esterase n=1 Tax=Teichococcus deserti TaxID=1817963 RepID=A0A1V2GYX2_9PROT|nr:hypothetical protein BKE38_18660 [Pseudoroseomonas deserti]
MAALACPAVARAQQAATLPGTTQHDLDSASGQPFRVFLHVPDGAPPPGGWPLVTVLDANAVMGLVVDTLRLLAFLPREAGIRSAAVVAGIGYRSEGPYDLARRSYDLTPPPQRELPAAEGRPARRIGGADALLDFIEAVAKPLAARAAPVDATRQALLGHSLGGLCTLHALFTRPKAFSGYVAGSPSIWWQEGAILAEAGRFAARADRPAGRRLLLTVGGHEQAPAPWHDPAWGPRMAAIRMVDNAREMADRLRPLPGLEVDFALLPGEGHMSAFPQAVQRGLRFLLAG